MHQCPNPERLWTDLGVFAKAEHPGEISPIMFDRVSEQLIRPIEGALEPGALALVGNGPAQVIPFSALKLSDGSRVADSFDLTFFPNLQSIDLRGDFIESANARLAIFAGPDYGEFFNELPYAEQEGKVISDTYRDRLIGSFIGPQATKSRFLEELSSGEANIVHVATHAEPRKDFGRLSALIFAHDGDHSKSRVTQFDAVNATNDLDLLVLSGCGTGVGRLFFFDGTRSLGNGFLNAGTSRVLTSLWPVSDRATEELMVKFYEGILEEGMPIAQALGNAQRQMRENRRWQHPYYWAGWTVSGMARDTE